MESVNLSNSQARVQSLVSWKSWIYVIVPAAALIIAIAIKGIFLDYTHVLFGGMWTGIDLYMGLVLGPILGKVSPQARTEIIKRLVPVMLFLMPSIATVAITAGIYLAMSEGIFSLSLPVIIAAGIIVAILTIQGFGVFLPNEVRIFLELNKEKPDIQKMSRLAMMNFRLSGVQAIFQIAIIFIMANIAMNNYYLHF